MSIIAVDFDGTLCKDKYPHIGDGNYPLLGWLKTQQAKGDKIILWTCRCGDMLDKAVAWCRVRGLIFDAINENLPENIAKYGNDCRKVFANIYLDDKSGYIGRISPFPIYVRPFNEYKDAPCWTARDKQADESQHDQITDMGM